MQGSSMLEALRQQVVKANQAIVRHGLVLSTFGNVSAIDRAQGLVAIKPSGVPYADLKPDDIVVTDLDGKIVAGTLRPSSDLDTHLVLYRAFASIGAVVHTHSEFATIWAQANRSIPCYGTTHADYFYGPVPCTPVLSAQEVQQAYVRNTGEAIVRHFHSAEIDPVSIPAVLVAGHAPFCWGATLGQAVHHAVILEFVARMALHTESLSGGAGRGIPQHLLDHHHQRKHGANATYGQGSPQSK
jgi:L-ribulose-5-phosphate 4-epimerase